MKILWSNSPQTLPEILDRFKENWLQNVKERDIYVIQQYQKVIASLQKEELYELKGLIDQQEKTDADTR